MGTESPIADPPKRTHALMDHRLDFSDLVEFSDLPDTIPPDPDAPVPLTLDDLASEDPTPEALDGDGAAPPPTVAPDLTTRCLAKLLDVAAGAVLYGLVSAFFSDWFLGFLLGGLAASVYLLVSDGLDVDFMKRRSLGKRVMNLTVERIDGERMDLAASVRRNWMFSVVFFAQAFTFAAPVLSVLLLLAAIGVVGYEVYWIVTNPDGIRWGDDLAATEVRQPAPVATAAAR